MKVIAECEACKRMQCVVFGGATECTSEDYDKCKKYIESKELKE